MAGEIYFQWQNQALLDTIYPMRDVKLRDFLLAYYEIDIWKSYKDKKPGDIAGDVADYCAEETGKLTQAADDYARLLSYLLDEDVTDQYQKDYPNPDPDILAKIHLLHKSFKTYYPNYKNPIQQKYFISARVREFEDLYKATQFQINDKQRILRNMGPTWALKDKYAGVVLMLTNTSIKMVRQELDFLKTFLTAYTRLDQYKQQVNQIRDQKEKDRAAAAAQLNTLLAQEITLSSSLDTVTRQLQRIKTPPDPARLMTYFTTSDVTLLYHPSYPDPDPDVLLAINNLHAAGKAFLPGYKNPVKERYFVSQRAKDLEDLRVCKQQELTSKQRASQYMPPTWWNRAENDKAIQRLVNVSLKMLDFELNQLYDFLWCYDLAGKPPTEVNALITQKRQEQAGIQSQLQANRAAQAAQNAILQSAGALLNTSERDQLTALVNPARVTVEDIVRGKIEDYKTGLKQKTVPELLEEVVARFTQEPARYPLWLQYMVIHFSGMRYQTAHGSWADPKDLLLSLRTKAVSEEVRGLSEQDIASLCEQKYYLYKSVLAPSEAAGVLDDQDHPLPLLAKCTEPEWRDKLDYHLSNIAPTAPAYKRGALKDLRVDEENYAIEKMTDQQVYDELEGLKDKIPLPDWMWKEIVQVTQLRLKEATDSNWEKLSQADLDARWAAKSAYYRQVMDDWKARYLTGWRKEHELTEDLIVTRAVCNEVAEHIQHVRGNNPGAGLSARPGWYMAQERGGVTAPGDLKPFFVKVQSDVDLRPAASILYLRWVNKLPDPWNIASPLALKNGEDLIHTGSEGASRVTNTGSSYMRTATIKTANAQGILEDQNQTQWLRWMHEATIVEVADTVDGRTVYTFETALPFDDKRQAAIGIFKHTAGELRFMGTPSVLSGVLCGFVPDGKVPYDKLRDKLNWNHILLREAFTQQQLDDLWAAAAPQGALVEVVPSFGIEVELEDLITVEVAPPLKQRAHKDWITCLQLSARGTRLRTSRPPVDLPRGMRLVVDRAAQVQTARGVYYPVRACKLEPRVIGLYVPAASVLDVPSGQGSQAMRVKRDITLHCIARAGRTGVPILQGMEIFLPAGTRLRVSTIHCAGLPGPGAGVIRANDQQDYLLIVDCPRRISVQGLLVRKDALQLISESEYDRNSLLL